MKNTLPKISEYGNLLMYDRSYSASDAQKIIQVNRLKGLRIFDHWDPLPSLDFLREFTFLTALEVACRYDQDFSFLSDLPQLEHFSLGPSYPMKNHVDLSGQVNARYLSIQWSTNKISGLDACREVDDLCLVEFPKSDLSVISSLFKVKQLQVKTGSMNNLNGIEHLTKLEDLELGNCRNLKSIGDLSGLQQLRRIRIESCRNIQDTVDLYDLPNLIVLEFVNCGEIPELDIETRFPKLKKIELLGETKLRPRN